MANEGTAERTDYEVWVEGSDEDPQTGDLEPITYCWQTGLTLDEAMAEAHFMSGDPSNDGAIVKLDGQTVRRFEVA